MSQVTFVLGGAGSGKSLFAERLVTAAPGPWLYLATAEARDAEMRAKIDTHQARRGAGWELAEAPHDPAAVLAGATMPVLLDCATLWLTNRLLAEADLAAESAALVAALGAAQAPVTVVSNEVGQGIVPADALSRRFRAAQGALNQQLAAIADTAILVVAGLPMVLKGALPEGLS